MGSSNSQSGAPWSAWDDPTSMFGCNAEPRIWRNTGLKPEDMAFASMYDCFTYTVMATLEGLGIVTPGQVGEFFRQDRAAYG